MTETVKIQISAPIEKVAPKNDRRYHLAGVYIDGKNKRACATDGKILAVQKLENVDDENVMYVESISNDDVFGVIAPMRA